MIESPKDHLINIMYLLDHLKMGGAQKHLIEVLKHLNREKFNPTVCVLKKEGDLFPELDELEVEVFEAGLKNSLKEWNTIKLLGKMILLLRNQKIHILHSYLFHPNILGTMAARLGRIPVALVSKRSLDSYAKKTELLACKAANWLADKIVVNSFPVKDFICQAEGCGLDKIVTIPNGIDLHQLKSNGKVVEKKKGLGINPSAPVVGTVARLSWKKALQYFIEAAARILKVNPATQFLLVGDGPLRDDLERQAMESGIKKHIIFTGQVSNISEILDLFDVFVLSSLMEGMSNALLEAMAMQKPTVVTGVGGNQEVVLNGKTGYIVPPRNADLLAEAILKVLSDKKLAQQMGQEGRKVIEERFTSELMVKRMEGLYEELLAEKGLFLGVD